jgi:hypothetical protein
MAYIKKDRLWIGPEFDPGAYETRDGRKVLKPERAAELEAEMMRDEAYEQAVARKRLRRQLVQQRPATPVEIEGIKARLRQDEAQANLEKLGIVLVEGADADKFFRGK